MTTALVSFNVAQTIAIDPALSFQNVAITSIDVYFKYKPAANNNISGVQLPGVTMYLTPTIFGVPQITQESLLNVARCEWSSIVTSSDATVPTKFHFLQPVQVTPGQNYAIVLAFDGNDTFEPWTAVNGYWLVGTRNVYASKTNPYAGSYFEFVSTNDPTNNPTSAQTQAQYQSFWTALNNTQMTFDVYAARYFISGVPVLFAGVSPTTPIIAGSVSESWNPANNTLTFSYPSNPVEGISFDINSSTVQTYIGAQRVFQNTFPYPGGWANNGNYVTVSSNATVFVTANSQYPNGTAFNWNTIYPTLNTSTYITLNNNGEYDVRKVAAIISNTVIQLDEPTTWTNALANFMITPVGTIDSTISASPYGIAQNFLFLNWSSANSTVRFVNNVILSTSNSTAYITAGGTGYNNNEVLYVQGFEDVSGVQVGGYKAVANLITNSSGGITNLYFSNLGCGFVNTSNMFVAIANSSSACTGANTSNGSGATFNFTIGADLLTEFTTNIFRKCTVVNLNIDDVVPYCQIYNPVGTTFDLRLTSQYYAVQGQSTYSGYAYFVQPPQTFPVHLGVVNPLISNTPPAFVSYSNEFNTLYANGQPNDLVTSGQGYSNSWVLNVDTVTTALDDYIAVNVQTPPTIQFGHYIINNDYTKENTNFGNAWAKHVATQISFNAIAEDIRVFLTVYKPANTDFKVFARIQNQNDPEAFSAEDWTLLQQITGIGLVSSSSDPTDYVELGYGFPLYPNTSLTLTNSVSTTNNSAVVTGTGFVGQANLQVGSVIKIYAPLFPNADLIVASVNVVSGDTSITLDQNVSSNVNIGGNPALVGAGLTMDVIGYPNQAWNNINNSNVVNYYNTSIVRYDGYNTLQLKIVMLSSKFGYIPQINSIRALGVTA